MNKRDPIAAIGLAVAFGLFGLTFRGSRARFWERMTLTGFVLGNMALANEAELRRQRFRERDVALGLRLARSARARGALRRAASGGRRRQASVGRTAPVTPFIAGAAAG